MGYLSKSSLLFLLLLFTAFLFPDDRVYKAGLPIVPGFMYRQEDGSPGGFPVEVTAALAEGAGITLEWVDGSWSELYNRVKKGEIDLLPGTMITQERKQYLDFLDGELNLQWGEFYIHPKGEYTDVRDLQGKLVGLVNNDNNGSGFVRYLSSIEIRPKFIFYEDFQESSNAVLSGEIIGMAGPSGGLSDGADNGLKATGLIFNPTTISISFPKGENTELNHLLSLELERQKLETESPYFMLLEKYKIGEHSTEGKAYIPTWVRMALLIGIGLLAVVMTFLYFLEKQVKEKSRNLQDYRLKLTQALLTSGMGYWEYWVLTEEIRFSPEIYQLLDLTQERDLLTWDQLYPLFTPESVKELEENFKRVAENRDRFNSIMRITNRNGREFWLEFIGNLDSNIKESYHMIQGICIDITEKKHRDEELQKKEELLQHTHKMKSIGQLAGGIAHDFNNMLAGIMGYAEILFNDLQGEQKAYAGEVIQIGERASELTRQLLSYARKEKMETQEFDVHQCIKSVFTILERTIKSPIQMTKELDALQSVVTGDFAKIQNALMNMALNSRDAMPKGGWLSIRTVNENLNQAQCDGFPFELTPGTYIKIEIEDTGQGISSQDLDKVFEPFFTTKPLGKGTGLGLASSYGTIVSHHGAIRIESDLDKGTQITLFLPVSDVSEISDALDKMEK